MNPLDHLRTLQLTLPEVPAPGGNYVSVNIRETLAFIAIQFPILNRKFLYQGRLGDEISTEDGYAAMQLCALNVLAQINTYIGFNDLIGLNHLNIYFQSAENWDASPDVADGASDLMVKVLEAKGTHSRAIFGVHKLPRNFCVGLTATCTIKKN